MKTMKISSLIRVLAVATGVAGAGLAVAQTDRTGSDDGRGTPYRGNDSIPPGTPPGSPAAVPASPDERGWRQTQEESDAIRRSDGAIKGTKDQVEGENWTPARSDLPDRDAMRDGDTNRNGRKLTAQDAGTSVGDREIARQTRRAVVEDKSLSTAAHNVKIISRGGTVTLKGRVETEAEKQNIADKTAAIVGAENVVNKLTVKTSKKSKSYGGNP